MSEEQNVETNDGTWSSLKKTIIGAISTAILAGGTWVTTHFLGGSDSKEETKTEQTAPAAAPVINLNVDNSSKNMNNGGGTTTIIKEKEVVKEKSAEKKEEKKKSESEDAPW